MIVKCSRAELAKLFNQWTLIKERFSEQTPIIQIQIISTVD